jgi:HK97 family phage major capsid protein
MSHTSARLAAQVRAEAGEASKIVKAAEVSGRNVSRSEMARIKNHLGKAEVLKAQLDQHRSTTSGIQAAAAGITSLGAPVGDGGPNYGTPVLHNQTAGTGQTPGQQFTASAEYKGLLSQRGSNDSPWSTRRVAMSPVTMAGSIRNALITGSSEELLGTATTSGGVLVQPTFRGILPESYARELTLVDLLTVVPVGTDTIEYARVASVTNAAAAVAEATTADLPTAPGAGGELIRAAGGGYKPESSVTFEQVQDFVRTIAHVLPVTKKALADARQLQVVLDAFMRYGLEEELEDLILVGNGSGQNFQGFLNAGREQTTSPAAGAITGGTLDGVQKYTPAVSESIIDSTLHVKTMARLGRGGAPTAYLMSPVTLERFQLLKDSEARFYAGGPFEGSDENSLRLWRLPVVQSEAMSANVVLCGNYRQGVLFDREQASLVASDSHEDYFIRNLVMILAELRAGFGVLHEPAFCKTTLV